VNDPTHLQEGHVGLFGSRNDEQDERPVEDDSMAGRTATALVGKLMDVGLDGLGPLDSAGKVVDDALEEEENDPERAIDRICRTHIRMAAAGGFATGVGGLFTLPVALPANIVEFYVLATRMVGSLASIRGYDVTRPEVRSAVLLTLVGADSDDLLRKAGVTGGGRLAQVALKRLPDAAMMVINKGVGFRLATQLGAKTLGRLGRAVPLAGGVIGAGLDGYLMNRIADNAREEFPLRAQLTQG
jgi:hypothetical protein